jgi:hypothetical protein
MHAYLASSLRSTQYTGNISDRTSLEPPTYLVPAGTWLAKDKYIYDFGLKAKGAEPVIIQLRTAGKGETGSSPRLRGNCQTVNVPGRRRFSDSDHHTLYFVNSHR